jgi:hypothetical protein
VKSLGADNSSCPISLTVVAVSFDMWLLFSNFCACVVMVALALGDIDYGFQNCGFGGVTLTP